MVVNHEIFLRSVVYYVALYYLIPNSYESVIFSNEPALTWCYLPPKPEGTNYTIGGCEPHDTDYFFCRSDPGRVVQQFMQVIYHCEGDYQLPEGMEGVATAFCINGRWEPGEIICEDPTLPTFTIGEENTETYPSTTESDS